MRDLRQIQITADGKFEFKPNADIVLKWLQLDQILSEVS